MKNTLSLFLLVALAYGQTAYGQTANVQKSLATATLNQISGDLTFGSGKTLTMQSGSTLYAPSLTAAGTNQSITLTPSGSGLVKVAALPTNAGNATAGSFTGVAFAAIINAAYGLVYGSSQSSGDGWIQQQSVVSGAYYNLSLQASGGNVLLERTLTQARSCKSAWT